MHSDSALICILDDDASVFRSIRYLLASDGLSARIFERADEFLAHAREREVRVAVVDYNLGDVNGLDVQAQLRVISPGTRVIMITGSNVPDLKATALQNGARAFLYKPFEDELFLAHIRDALER
jgi:two-component system response regulator FixJ